MLYFSLDVLLILFLELPDGLPLPPPPALTVKVLDNWKNQHSLRAARIKATLGAGQTDMTPCLSSTSIALAKIIFASHVIIKAFVYMATQLRGLVKVFQWRHTTNVVLNETEEVFQDCISKNNIVCIMRKLLYAEIM